MYVLSEHVRNRVTMLRWNHKKIQEELENITNANISIILLMIMCKLVLKLNAGCRVSYEKNVGFKSEDNMFLG